MRIQQVCNEVFSLKALPSLNAYDDLGSVVGLHNHALRMAWNRWRNMAQKVESLYSSILVRFLHL